MLKIYLTENENVYGKLKKYLSELLPQPAEIARTENGKPYLEGNPLFFSISHSGGKALIAICDKPVGADIEVIRERNYKAVLSRFRPGEQSEISDVNGFLRHWVVREAYIKMSGTTIAHKLYDLSYIGGTLYDCGKEVGCELINGSKDGCVYCICTAK